MVTPAGMRMSMCTKPQQTAEMNASCHSSILNQLCQSGLVDLTILHLKVLCCSQTQQQQENNSQDNETSTSAANSVCDVMFQMTACLRYIA